jgi:hypothetical protein
MPKTHKTRFKELGFWNLEPGCWQVVDLSGDKPAQVGCHYSSKAELLANLEAYAYQFGCEDANPYHFQNITTAAAEARARGYAVVIFTPEELEGASPNRVQDRLIELAWDVISDLKPDEARHG